MAINAPWSVAFGWQALFPNLPVKAITHLASEQEYLPPGHPSASSQCRLWAERDLPNLDNFPIRLGPTPQLKSKAAHTSNSRIESGISPAFAGSLEPSHLMHGRRGG